LTKAVLKLGCNPTNRTNRSILGQLLFEYLFIWARPPYRLPTELLNIKEVLANLLKIGILQG
jgi:hypothetical protein